MKICLVSCVSLKSKTPAAARDLYISPLFRGARRFAESRFDRWYILSAKYGLVEPSTRIAPYEKTLKSMPQKQRRQWAEKVTRQLRDKVKSADVVAFIAGKEYREFLTAQLEEKGVAVAVPFEGMSIGRQLQWFNKLQREHRRLEDLDRFYSLLSELEAGVGGKRKMSACTGKMKWPNMGVYFFFEPREFRMSAPKNLRIVRVGTHTVSKGSKSSLWQRLRTHRGATDLSGNHRGSIFRLHVGSALLRRNLNQSPTWGVGQTATKEIRAGEVDLERKVSHYIGAMSLLWLAIEDEPSIASDRSYIERNSIGLLAGHTGPIDLPRPHWLGRYSNREAVRKSGLWNVNYVDDDYDPDFLSVFATYVQITIGRKRQTKKSLAPRGWLSSLASRSRGQLLFDNL